MIPEIYIEGWRSSTNWQTIAMVEQDLIISRALICLYNNEKIKNTLVFRGGTALNKLFLNSPARYSEDIDFVQREIAPIGETINTIRNVLKDWLGEPKRKITQRSVKLIYQYVAIDGLPAKLKIEINTTEHFQVLYLKQKLFSIDSAWFQGKCNVVTYELEELMATKLRALYQRRKGRDLFDLWYIFSQQLANIELTLDIFKKYCLRDGNNISKELFLKNLEMKKLNKDFQVDMYALLPNQINWNFEQAFEFVQKAIINKI